MKDHNTNWRRSEEAFDDIPGNTPGLVGRSFLIKTVKAVKSREAPGADRIMAKALKAGREKMAEMLLKICNAAWHQKKLPYPSRVRSSARRFS